MKREFGFEKEGELLKEAIDELESLCMPVIVWLQKNMHPHSKILITNASMQLTEVIVGQAYDISDSGYVTAEEADIAVIKATKNAGTIVIPSCGNCKNYKHNGAPQ